MPHEIIMPALGMTQDSGLIVSWLKQPGDTVKTGDSLFEVETDKATMEVEAQSDGFLTNVSAKAGDNVPVGQVIALISETAEAADTSPADAPHVEKTETETDPGDAIEGRQVIMPALGMTQDTGLIVNWLKQPGDQVAADDVLLEVETDKSTMEVPAGHDGYIAATLAEAGENVPVGKAIAVISSQKPANPVARRHADSAAAEQPAKPDDSEPEQVPLAPSQPQANRADSQTGSIGQIGGRILASPKMRRLAREQGLELALLVEHGVPQPYHVADLETLKDLRPTETTAASTEANRTGTSPAAHHVEARVPVSGCDEFIAWMARDGNIELQPNLLWLRFATSALRSAASMEQENIVVETRSVDVASRFVNADRTPASTPAIDESDAAPHLVLRDLTGSPIIVSTTPADRAPVLSIGRTSEEYVVSLDYLDCHFTEDSAISFVTGFAERLCEPLGHLI